MNENLDNFEVRAHWCNDGTADLDMYCELPGCEWWFSKVRGDVSSATLADLVSAARDHLVEHPAT